MNRALDLVAMGREVTLVDMDVVEPCYTLRPIKKELQAQGLNVVAWETRDTVGLGEAGTILKAEARWALRRSGDIIFDIGYGVDGLRTLNLIEGVEDEPSFTVLAVVNISRPMTATADDIVAYTREMGVVDGLINNTHMVEETTVQMVQEGARVVAEAARRLGIPVVATTAVAGIADKIGPKDAAGNPVRVIKRYMPRTFW